MPVFSTADGVFSLDGKPMTILSGAIHYFRTHPDQWRDRLEKLKDCGFNTVETYTPWNLHEKTPGKFDFTGMLDIGRFLDLAADRAPRPVHLRRMGVRRYARRPADR